jgi:hypothetical protein
MTALWRNAAWLLGLAMAAVGCSKDEASADKAYDGLYVEQSSNADTKTVFGIWGNKKVSDDGLNTFESRVRLSADQVMSATRCTQKKSGASIVVGVTASAVVTQDHIKITESETKSSGDQKYGSDPEDTCFSKIPVFEEDLVLSGGKLSFAGDVFDKFAD